MSQQTLNLPDDVAAALDEASREARRSPEEIASDLIKRALAARRFRSFRESLIGSLGQEAPEADEDLFKTIS